MHDHLNGGSRGGFATGGAMTSLTADGGDLEPNGIENARRKLATDRGGFILAGMGERNLEKIEDVVYDLTRRKKVKFDKGGKNGDIERKIKE